VPLNYGAMLSWRARLAWAHDWVSDLTLLTAFQALPGGGTFVINGATPAKNSALASAGTEIRLRNNVTIGGRFTRCRNCKPGARPRIAHSCATIYTPYDRRSRARASEDDDGRSDHGRAPADHVEPRGLGPR
jgi:hypothetical protein